MDDGSRVQHKGFQYEWSLLVQSFIDGSGHEVDIKPERKKNNIKSMLKKNGVDLSQISLHKEALSQERKIANIKIESIKSEIDQLNVRIENLDLVGGDITEIESEIQKLNELGIQYFQKIQKIEKEFKSIRFFENYFLEENNGVMVLAD